MIKMMIKKNETGICPHLRYPRGFASGTRARGNADRQLPAPRRPPQRRPVCRKTTIRVVSIQIWSVFPIDQE